MQLPRVTIEIGYFRHASIIMYLNFQQNRVTRSVITVHTTLFEKKKHKFATTYRNLENIDYFRHASSFKVDVMYINFQQNRVSRSVKNHAHKYVCKKLKVA